MGDEAEDEFLARLWKAYTALLERERGKVSQAKLAERIEKAGGHPTRQDDISRWLRGVGRPSYEELPGVARALGVRRWWLAFNDGPMIEPSKDGGRVQVAHDRPAKGQDRPAKREQA